MTVALPLLRLAGWGLAGTTAAALLIGVGLLGIVTDQRRIAPITLDLTLASPAAPVVAAIADAPPVANVDAAALAPALAPDELPPLLPAAATPPRLPDLPAGHAATVAPAVDTPAANPFELPPPEPITTVAFDTVVTPTIRARPRPIPRAAVKKAPAPTPPARAATATRKTTATHAGATTAPQAATVANGNAGPAYARAVMQKVRATRRARGTGRGTATVGFNINRNGTLASAQILRSSGNPTLDAAALDHIRRAAPFRAPPAGIDPSFSFEFVGK